MVWFPPSIDVDEWKIHRAIRGRSSTDALLGALADLQHGVVGRLQLLELGVKLGEIETRVRSRHLCVVWRGVYAVGRRVLTPAGTRMAAVLAAGDGARLCGWSGATQRGWLPHTDHDIDIAIPPARRIALSGVRPRRTQGAVVLADGVPTHAPADLLLDLSALNGPDVLEWGWRQAIYHGDLDVDAVAQLLAERGGDPGTPALRQLYERRATIVGTIANRFELLMLGIIREAGLPEPLCNHPWEVAPGVILTPDFRIPEILLVIESDGRDGHADVEQILGDEGRDALYRANRHRCIRYGYWEARRERTRVRTELAAHRG